MIFTLFLGGYLLPKTQYRISEHREYIIYQALCRNHMLDVIDTNISMLTGSLALVQNQNDLTTKINSVNNLLQKKQIIKAQDFFGLQTIEDNKNRAKTQGLTGDTSIDKLLRLHKLLSEYDIIRK